MIQAGKASELRDNGGGLHHLQWSTCRVTTDWKFIASLLSRSKATSSVDPAPLP